MWLSDEKKEFLARIEENFKELLNGSRITRSKSIRINTHEVKHIENGAKKIFDQPDSAFWIN